MIVEIHYKNLNKWIAFNLSTVPFELLVRRIFGNIDGDYVDNTSAHQVFRILKILTWLLTAPVYSSCSRLNTVGHQSYFQQSPDCLNQTNRMYLFKGYKRRVFLLIPTRFACLRNVNGSGNRPV